MKIFLTGDSHRTIDLRKLIKFNDENPNLTKEDLVIILGDAGIVWNELNDDFHALVQTYENFNFSTAYILGNHEDYDLLKTFPKEVWNGGIVRRISDSIIQLENGEIFNINNKNFFVMGGAESIDKHLREKGKTWWPQEIPSTEQRLRAIQNFLISEVVEGFPDYMLTHTPPAAIIQQMHYSYLSKCDEYSKWLNYFLSLEDEYGMEWYCGHMHEDITVSNPYCKFNSNNVKIAVSEVNLLYNQIVEI